MPDDIGGEIVIEDAALAGGFVQVPAVVMFDQALSAGAKVTFGALLWYGWRDGRFPGQRIMAEELGGGERTIRRHLAELQDAGYIAFQRVGLGKPNRCVVKSLQGRSIPDRPKMAGQTGHERPINAANSGRSLQEQDSKAHTSQQQERPAKPGQAHDKGLPAARRTAVVASHVNDEKANDVTARLAALGVAKSTGQALLKQHGPELVGRWIAYTEHKLRSGWLPKETPAAWLVSAIRAGDWIIPEWFNTPEEEQAAAAADREAAQERARQQAEAQERDREEAAAQRRELEAQLGIDDATRELWQRVRELLEERGEGSLALASAYLLPLAGDVATVATPVAFFCKVIVRHEEAIRAALEELTGRPVRGVEVRGC